MKSHQDGDKGAFLQVTSVCSWTVVVFYNIIVYNNKGVLVVSLLRSYYVLPLQRGVADQGDDFITSNNLPVVLLSH